MKCSACGNSNPDGAKFCNNCGQKLPAGCPNCGNFNPEGAKFCNNCGADLRVPAKPQPASPAGLDALRPYLPSELQARLETAHALGGVEGERRIVTILFCDVKGSTEAASRLDPEEWTEIINGAFEPMIGPVQQYGGTVVRLMGDGILALFGAPIAHEDDPQRAVLAGLAIVEGVTGYGEKVKARWGIEFSVRVGINTGLVVVGAVGSADRLEYTAMGDAINIAARMEQTADPGTVRIAEETWEAVASQFDAEDLGEIAIRGKDKPVPAYRILRSRPGTVRRPHLSSLQTPLIGRDWELRALEQAMVRVRSGEGGIVCLIGDAGMGKSRLLREAFQRWRKMTDLPERWYLTGSLSYESGIPYAQFQRLLRQGAGIVPGDKTEAIRSKLSLYVGAFPEDEQPQAQQIFEQIFGLPPTNGRRTLEGEVFKSALFDTMLRLTRAWSSQEPMVLVLDDLQWADPATVELLIHLFQLANQARILFLCATRIDRQSPGWKVTAVARERFAQCYTEIWLHALSRSDSENLLDSLAGPAGLAASLRKKIVHKTEGNPLFVEEVVLSILEENGQKGGNVRDPQRRADSDDIEIPDTLQALLLSRVDRLAEEARYLVQLASVVGYQFQREVLQSVVELPVDVDQQLAILQQHELIREIDSLPSREFAFRHALIQDAVYQSILRSQRRAYHLRVARALKSLYPNRLTEFATLLAHHSVEGGDIQSAIGYYILAGDTAAALYANAEAISHYGTVLKLARDQDVATEDLSHVYRSRGRVLEMLGRHKEAAGNHQELEDLGKRLGDRSMELAGLAARATLYAIPTSIHDPHRGRQLSQRALLLAREVGDHEAEARILWNLLLASKFAGTPSESIAYGEESLAVARRYNLRQQMAYTLNDLAIFAYVDAGRTDDALATLGEAQPLWQELGNRPMQADNRSSYSIVQFLKGSFAEASEASQEAMTISQQIGNLWGQAYSQWTTGDILFEQGHWSEAIGCMKNCIDLATRAEFTGAAVGVGSSLAFVYGAVGAFEKGLAQARKVQQLAEEGLTGWLVWPLSIQAQLLLKLGRVEEAAGILGRVSELFDSGRVGNYLPYVGVSVSLAHGQLALAKGDLVGAGAAASRLADYLDRTSIRVFMPDSYKLSAEILLCMEKPETAVEHLRQAVEIARDIGSQRSLWSGLAMLARVEDRLGRHAEAADHRSEAAGIRGFIGDRISDASMRTGFLEQSNLLLAPEEDR